MKKIMFLAVSALLVCSATAFAFPIDCSGVVDPNFYNSWNVLSASGTARYTFYFENDPSISINSLSLAFEPDVFKLSEGNVSDPNALDSGDFSVVNPVSGWSTAFSRTTSGGVNWYLTSGNAINANLGPIIVDVNYTLQNVDRMYAATGSNWSWNEGQAWGQSFLISGPNGEFGPGSTSPVPEPATMAMLGMGVLGLFGLKRKA